MRHTSLPFSILTRADLGRALRAERQALGKTQAELARTLRCRRQTIGDLEAGANTTTAILFGVLGCLGKQISLTAIRPTIEEAHRLRDDDEEAEDDDDASQAPGD